MQIRLRFGRSRVRRVRRRESDVVSRGCRTASDAFRLIVDPRASEALCAPLHVLLSPQFLPRFIYCLVVLDLRVDAKPPVTVGWETILSLYSLAAFGSIWQHLAASFFHLLSKSRFTWIEIGTFLNVEYKFLLFLSFFS
jgi:hypothetical protein